MSKDERVASGVSYNRGARRAMGSVRTMADGGDQCLTES